MIWQTVTEMSASLRISPAPLFVLRVDDQIDRELELFSNVRPLGHPVHFRQKQRGETVAVHGILLALFGGRDESRRIGVGQQVLHDLFDVRAVLPAIGAVSRREKRNSRQCGHGDVPAVGAPRTQRSVVILVQGQVLESAVDRLLNRRGDELEAARVNRPGDARRSLSRNGR
jgi:hypothetical protein